MALSTHITLLFVSVITCLTATLPAIPNLAPPACKGGGDKTWALTVYLSLSLLCLEQLYYCWEAWMDSGIPSFGECQIH